MMRSVNFVRHFLLVCFMLHSAILHAGGAETIRIQLGEHLFNIPKQNIREEIPFWLKFVPGLAPTKGGLLFTISAEEMAKRVAGYQEYDGTLELNTSGVVEVLSEDELQAYLDPGTHIYSDVWYSRGLYEGLIVEWREEFRFYKAY